MCHAGHQHHWLIEAMTGPTSPGRCIHCGATKEFSNYLLAETDARAFSLPVVGKTRARPETPAEYARHKAWQRKAAA